MEIFDGSFGASGAAALTFSTACSACCCSPGVGTPDGNFVASGAAAFTVSTTFWASACINGSITYSTHRNRILQQA